MRRLRNSTAVNASRNQCRRIRKCRGSTSPAEWPTQHCRRLQVFHYLSPTSSLCAELYRPRPPVQQSEPAPTPDARRHRCRQIWRRGGASLLNSAGNVPASGAPGVQCSPVSRAWPPPEVIDASAVGSPHRFGRAHRSQPAAAHAPPDSRAAQNVRGHAARLFLAKTPTCQ